MKFNREKSKNCTSIQVSEKRKVEKMEKMFLTSFGVFLILFGSLLNNNKNVGSHIENEEQEIVISEYDKQRSIYLENVHKYREELTDTTLYDFYKNGKLIMNYNGKRIESNLKALYLRYGKIDNNKFVFLSNVLNGRNVDIFTNEDKSFAEDYCIIEFRNTSIFEEIYNNNINFGLNSTIELSEEDTIQLINKINNWDGKINDIVPETKAVFNKQIWEVDSNEKKR